MYGEPIPGVTTHAGFPNPASDKNLDSLDIYQLLIKRPVSTFLFRIRGQEWKSLGIFDDDIAIVDRALDPRKSDLVIWWQEGKDGFMISEFKSVTLDANVWGVVINTIHQFRKD